MRELVEKLLPLMNIPLLVEFMSKQVVESIMAEYGPNFREVGQERLETFFAKILNMEEFKEGLLDIFQNLFTEEELQILVQWYSDPASAKIRKCYNQLTEYIAQLGAQKIDDQEDKLEDLIDQIESECL